MNAPRLFGLLLVMLGVWLGYLGVTHKSAVWWGAFTK